MTFLSQNSSTTVAKKTEHTPNKWAKFTYIGKETMFITKLFKNSSVKIAFTTNNTISKSLTVKPSQVQKQNRFDKSGVYQPTCLDCNMKYVDQTGRPFRVRFQEHFPDYKYANNKSKFAAHLLENKHSIGHIDDIMEVLHITNKGRFRNTVEKFHIYKETCTNNQIND
jgi:hypothetical protein